jgi:hypothetical protein
MLMTIKCYPLMDATMSPGPLTMALGAPVVVSEDDAHTAIVKAYDEETYQALVKRLEDNPIVVITTPSEMYEFIRTLESG